MLNTLSRNSHAIAWFFVAVFYLELVLSPVVVRAHERPLPYKAHVKSTYIWESPAGSREENSNKATHKMPDGVTSGLHIKGKKSPAGIKGTFTTGPVQPETQSFQSVNANNLVDLFTGDFSYNIPLLDVGGYPVNLHYQSGITMDQEASWVGLGWNINPGAITRNMRGLPDDFQGDAVTKTISIKPNKTFGVTVGANAELFGITKFSKVANKDGSVDTVKGRNGGVAGISLGAFHNTYKGWGTEFGLNANINAGSIAKGSLSAGLGITNNSQNGLDISPSIALKLGKEDSKTKGNITIGTNYNSRVGVQSLQMTGQVRQTLNDNNKTKWTVGISNTFNLSFARPSYTPTITIPYTTSAFSFTAKVGSEHWGLHPNFYVRGYGSKQEVDDKTLLLPGYGYLNYEKTGSKENVLLDFNREKDVAYSDNTPHIALPIYTYDTWSISGEGTGGMFRAYRGDIGYVFDHSMTTKSNSDRFSLDLGFGTIFHAGVDFNGVDAFSKTNPWKGDNNFAAVVPFRSKDTTYENVYFKNPGERTSVNKQYLAALGNDSLMRVVLSGNPENATAMPQVALFKGGRVVGSRTFDANTVRKDRDKRTQVITYLNAQEAACVGLDKGIKSYNINSFPATSCGNTVQTLPRVDTIHKAHHISEVSVLNADGRRYVYGIPVYNISQTEVTMSTQMGDNATGLVSYSGQDNSTSNNQGKDGYYNRETLPAYAHSFLLSGILSADYTDLTGDGITQDDIGDAVKFNYSKAYGFETPYKWRAPYDQNMAAYNEGLKTDSRDERGSFTYGKREVWYLNSVESKTMIATFVLETDSIRQDSYGAAGENGGRDASQKLYRLKEINLYAKADYLKYGVAGAKPIKAVHFDYSYELCKNNPGSLSGQGKLTLKRVWFSFNKNEKGRRNPYEFTYHAANPDFSAKSVDRWANYKNPKGNPGASGQELTNADYPYTLQDKVKNWDSTDAADSSAPWTLTQIKLPSGARLKVTYESDDYAYVQNKRAMQFFKVAGFGSSPSDAIKKNLFTPFTAGADYPYVFINVTEPVANKAEITRKYLDGVTSLYFKLAVNVPSDKWGKGFEFIPVYADIEDYGVKTGSSNKTIWIKVKPISGDESPFATTALQFLRLNLPSKAYPFSEPGDNLDFKTLVGTLATVAGNVTNTFNTFNKVARKGNLCNSVDTSKSFVRLDNPVYKKFGGGLRVKKVEVYDNYYQMTGHQQQESKYGQTYDYTTEIDINGITTRISSGVATYEPVIGSDENPFRVPQKLYPVKAGALAPADFMYTEDPLAETFFPAPMVGYSKVRVQTIHNDKKSANGFEETEFYTAKDFPVFVEYTPLDNDSKKSYNPAINNFLSFNAKHYITLSQGFKVELNDMHGKLKSQATYAQNDLTKPISYTYNYYRLKNDNAAQPKLSNTVAVVDSASGSIDTAAEIGKDIEIMVDVREETSSTVSKSLEVNMDFVHPFPPINIFTGIPLPSKETNRYRAIAIMKVVNRYGLLDSIIHIEKGSRVTTRNLLYDGETGDVLLSQTNNEFDDPVYNFSYPAHWAYSGMGPAYKNIGTVLKGVNFRKGIMVASNGERIATERYFESGDEILVYGSDTRTSSINDYCDQNYYQFGTVNHYFKIWAVDASKGKEKQKGIYFIDKNGTAVSANTQEIKIIRSGKRNMASVPVGSITSLNSPIKTVNNLPRLVFDSTTNVIAASAGRFKDVWKVDSTIYAKDTTIITARKMNLRDTVIYAVDNYSMDNYYDGDDRIVRDQPTWPHFEASSVDNGGDQDQEIRSWLKFDIQNRIPQGALIQSATLYLRGCINELQKNYRTSNSCYLERLTAPWPRQVLVDAPVAAKYEMLLSYFHDSRPQVTIETATRVTIPATTPHGQTVFRNDTVNITSMAQAMVDQYYSTRGGVSPGLRMRLITVNGGGDNDVARLIYNTAKTPDECPSSYEGSDNCIPYIAVSYFEPCAGGSQPTYSSWPDPGYYCYDLPVDTFLCKPNINDTAVNFYRFGVLGNWRMDRAYTYYGARMQSNPSDTSNIRTDGAIKNFVPYWSFTDSLLTASTDSTRWVWNSEMTAFNNKSNEIENHDPLNRYNAGQYGYNQTLPVAVAQNAQAREIAFDGFEDYGYRTDTCKKCVLNRHVDLGSGATLIDSVSHSGLYSLKVAGNNSVSRTIAIGPPEPAGPELSMKVDSTPIVKTRVSGTGAGLGNYYYTISGGCYDYAPNKPALYTGYTSNVNYSNTGITIPGTCRTNQLYFGFNGFIQPRYTGVYKFWVTVKVHDQVGIWITRNGVLKQITLGSPVEYQPRTAAGSYATDTMMLQAGELYDIKILWDVLDPNYQITLEWESQGDKSQVREIVPRTQLYPVGSDPATVKANTIVYDTTWCVKFKDPTATAVLNKRFSPLPGRKVLVSAWVKQDEQCITGNYDNAQLDLAFNNEEGQSLFQLRPTGNIIEGWQRIEDTLTIPANATSMSVNMYALSSTPVYFDDIRIQPFNANMKTFVYNPVNLRLMAELDENNYATFYEYDDDGTLIRVKKETERGVKTIKESRSALLKE